MALTTTEEAQLRDLIAKQAEILSLATAEPTIISKLGATKKNLSQLSSAVALGDTDLLFVRQGTTDKSITGAVVKTGLTTPNATDTVKGIVELATNAETQTGTDAVRAVTPASLQSKVASETAIGLVELATDAEAQAFTANKFIDGAKLNTALKGSNQSLATSGYQKLPGGLIIQWGSVTSSGTGEGNASITFPISFPNQTLKVFPVAASSGNSNAQLTSSNLSSASTTAYLAGVITTGIGVNWFAIGF